MPADATVYDNHINIGISASSNITSISDGLSAASGRHLRPRWSIDDVRSQQILETVQFFE
jgi:hypothetical protein